MVEALMKEKGPYQKGNLKRRRNDIDLEARKTKRYKIGDIHLLHHHQGHIIAILMKVNKEIMRARKGQISDLR